MTPPKHSYRTQPLSRHDPSQLGDTLRTTASVLTPPNFIQERALAPPPGLQRPYGAPSLPRHDHAGAACSLPPIWEALEPHTRELHQLRNTPSISAYPPIRETLVTAYNSYQCRKAPGSASIQAPPSLPSIGEALAVQYEAPSTILCKRPISMYLSSVHPNFRQDPGAPFLPTVVPAVAQTSGHGLQVSALSNQARPFKSHWYHCEFMSCDLRCSTNSRYSSRYFPNNSFATKQPGGEYLTVDEGTNGDGPPI